MTRGSRRLCYLQQFLDARDFIVLMEKNRVVVGIDCTGSQKKMCPYCAFPVLFSTPIRSGLGVLKGISVCRVVLFLIRLNPLFGGYVFKIGKLLIVSALGKESC